MNEVNRLERLQILVVEDEYVLASHVCEALARLGARIVGPFATVEAALSGLSATRVDAAIVDLNLGGEYAYPVADVLLANEIPFVFATGYDRSSIPEPYASSAPSCVKPLDVGEVAGVLANLVRRSTQS